MGAGGAVKQLEGREFTFKYTSVMTLKLLQRSLRLSRLSLTSSIPWTLSARGGGRRQSRRSGTGDRAEKSKIHQAKGAPSLSTPYLLAPNAT